ncbi:phage tail length tape measure family protein [Microvirga antarctica]|uniref:phage tail length tape measure family protein n=1 Tax=Microvirga antarctica TaxID=2819233 RepID=UPI001B31436D|nr:phage tail length tape measure family protein [Microvirga antarctica]
MKVGEIVREYRLEARAVGVQETTAAARALGAANDAVAITSERVEKRSLDAGRALESLARRMDADYRATQNLVAAQNLLDRAIAQGLGGTRSYEVALENVRLKQEQLARSAKGVTAANTNMVGQSANLAAQFNDIAVQLAGGTSPLTVALQQGTQISQVLGQAGAGGVVKSLGAAFLSVISPVSLLTVGIIAAGGAAVQYFATMGGGTQDLDDKLKRHSEIIKGVKDSYGEAMKGVEQYGETSKKVLESQLRASVLSLGAEIKKTSDEFLKSVSRTQHVRAGTGLSRASTTVETVDPQYRAFGEAIAKFREESARGAPDIRALRDAVADVMTRFSDNKSINEFGAKILDASKNASDLDNTLRAANGTLTATGTIAANSAERVKVFGAALTAINGLGLPDLTDAEKALEAYRKGVSAAVTPGDQRVIKDALVDAQARINIRDTTKAFEELTKAEQSVRLQGMKPLERATEEANAKFRERQVAIDKLKASGADSSAVTQMEARSHKLLAEEVRNAGAAEQERGAKSKDAFDDALTTAHARTQQIAEETRLLGQNGAELEANKLRIELEAQAKKKSIAMSDEVRASIEAEVAARRQAVQEHNAARMMGDLTFEQDQMGRSPVDQRVYSQLRSAGIEVNSVQGEMIADQIRFNEQLKETKDLAGEALKGFLSDMRNGVSASKALDNALARIGDRLAEKALDQLTGGLLGGKSGLNLGAANDNTPGSEGGLLSGLGKAIESGFGKIFGTGSLTEAAPKPAMEGGMQRAGVAAQAPGGGMGGLGGLAGGASHEGAESRVYRRSQEQDQRCQRQGLPQRCGRPGQGTRTTAGGRQAPQRQPCAGRKILLDRGPEARRRGAVDRRRV